MARRAPEITHKNLFSIEVDLLEPDQVAEAAKKAAGVHSISHVIHNAGMIWPNLIEEAKPSDIAGLAQLHLGSALTLTQAALPAMKARKFGRIMFNGSRAALGVPTCTAYSATKAGIIDGATWALELAPLGLPSMWWRPAPFKLIISGGSSKKTAPRRRHWPNGSRSADLALPKMSNAFLFFCDPKNSFVTGQTLYVCGGRFWRNEPVRSQSGQIILL